MKRKIEIDQQETEEGFPLVAPELKYLSAKYVVKLPVTDKHLTKSRWDLRVYVERLIERKLGDEIQMTSMKIRKPHLLAKTWARLRHQVPSTRMYVTIKF
jgi:hypothetical protein